MFIRADLQLLTLTILLTGCAKQRTSVVATSPAVSQPGSYIDLKAGWRVSVITPLFASSNQSLEPKDVQVSGTGSNLSVTMSAGSGFLGYETSYYAVEPQRNGVRVRFSSAIKIQDGKSTPQQRPVNPLFRLPRGTQHVRLIYLVRSSQADHNMAIVAAATPENLEAITRQVQLDPANGCRSRPGQVCQWIPVGIAVRPELRRTGTSAEWVPAR